MSLPIALQVYSIRDDAEKDFEGTMKKIREMGYDGVELAGLYGKTVAEIKTILDNCGLKLMSAHVPVPELQKDDVLDAYKAAGLKYIAIPWMKAETTDEGVATAIADITAIGKRCRERGMELLYHNHDFEFTKVGDKYLIDMYYENISPEYLNPEFDTCWVNVGGENPAEYLLKYAGRIKVVHIKDFKGKKTENMYGLIGAGNDDSKKTGVFELMPVGCGIQDLKSIVDASVKAGAEWLVVEQDSPSMGKTPLECAEISINNLKKYN